MGEPQREATGKSIVVAIGTSAGGLEALSLLFEALPAELPMAFVVLQHLSPEHESGLSAALARVGRLPVVDATEGMLLRPGRVHVMPAGTELSVEGGVLHLEPRPQQRGPHHPIDRFFRALAADRGDRAIGVVLSGTGSDGTDGLKAIKEAGGITFAQEPESAQFGGMPESAITAGLVDCRLPPAGIATELVRLSREPWLLRTGEAPADAASDGVKRSIELVRKHTGVDFSSYKMSTVARRISRRMALRRFDSADDYAAALESDPAEANALCQDMLIHVTSFFRDPAVFEVLRERILPDLLRQKAGARLRVWVPGCSTGEETYSIAICVLESLEEGSPDLPLQIFSSDLSGAAIEQARAGVYAESAVQGLGEGRLARFFERTGSGYRVSKRVRDLCVFAEHDLTRDPPFVRLDLISCRNVLIYFEPELQRRVLPLFHRCLNSPGYLLLGRNENIIGFDELFAPADPRGRIFEKRGPSRGGTEVRAAGPPGQRHLSAAEPLGRGDGLQPQVIRQADHLLLAEHAPPGVIVDDHLQVIQFRGDTGAFLAPPAGPPSQSLLKMLRPGLAAELSRALDAARERNTTVRAEGVRVKQREGMISIDLKVTPLLGPREAAERYFLVVFEEHRPGTAARPPSTPGEGPDPAQLEEELVVTKQYLQSMVEQHQAQGNEFATVNEELQSTNEELQSTNEELQSTNEELESAKEELQSVNDELRDRNRALDGVANDLINVLESVETPIVIVDAARRIRRFAPETRGLLNMIPSDVGRPLADIRPDIEAAGLDESVRQVIDTLRPHEEEVRDGRGHWYRLQVRPYRTLDRRLDGAVITLTDIDELKRAVALAEQANQDKDGFLSTLSHELRSPLATLFMQTDILEQRAAGDPGLQRVAGTIKRAAASQAQLIDDLLDVARIVSGKIQLDREVVDLREAARGASELVAASAETKGVEIAFEAASEVLVSADAARLQQIVLNLLRNAIKFTAAGGRVTVTVATRGGGAHVLVSDTGIGIEPEVLPRIFDRFFQAERGSNRANTGLGLGLSISRYLAEAHGGTLHAESPGAGQGSSFELTLPLHSVSWRRPSVATPHSSDIAGVRVLLVDDDREARQAMTAMLGQRGAEVSAAASATEALERIARFKPEVLLSDLAMPGEDGFSLIAKVRQLAPEHGGAVPAAAVTGLARAEDRDRALAAGFQMHVPKPVQADRLVQVVAELALPRAR